MSTDQPRFAAALAAWATSEQLVLSTTMRERARDALIDIVACMIGGSEDASTMAVLSAARGFGEGRALAFGTTARLPAPWAALVSGTAAHALDFDDNFAPGITHATAVTAPALLALGDELDVSGERLIEAYVVGLELQARIGRILNPGHYGKGWHATSTVGAIGTAGACARLLGLDASGIQAALSIASSMAAGSKVQFGSPMKPVHAGLAAKNAVLAARLAEAGLTGNPEPFSGPLGLQALVADGENDALAREALHDLGSRFALEEAGLLVKRFPCCGAAHKTLDAILALRAEHGIDAEAVEKVVTIVPAVYRQNLRFDRPQSETEARFSMTYCAARVLTSGQLRLANLTPEAVREPGIERVLRKVEINVDPSLERGIGAPVHTRILLADGRGFEKTVTDAVGSAAHPLTEQELRDKFADCCGWVGQEVDASYGIAADLSVARSVAASAEALREIAARRQSRAR